MKRIFITGLAVTLALPLVACEPDYGRPGYAGYYGSAYYPYSYVSDDTYHPRRYWDNDHDNYYYGADWRR